MREAARAETHIAISGTFGQIAPKLRRSKRLYLGLRPSARDVVYQRRLMRVNANAARSYSIHTTGYAFDIARSYATPRQAQAFQYVLERLEALHAIAWIREAEAIHIAVASKVSPALLRRVG